MLSLSASPYARSAIRIALLFVLSIDFSRYSLFLLMIVFDPDHREEEISYLDTIEQVQANARYRKPGKKPLRVFALVMPAGMFARAFVTTLSVLSAAPNSL